MTSLRMVAPSPWFSRTVIGLLGLSHLALAFLTTNLGYIPGAKWWALLFVVAAVTCLDYAFTMRPEAAVLAGAFTIVAYAFRGGALLLGYAAGDRTLTTSQLLSGLVVFATLILAWGPVFWKITVPNAAYRHRARLSERT